MIWQEICNFGTMQRVTDHLVSFGTVSQQLSSPPGLLSYTIGDYHVELVAHV